MNLFRRIWGSPAPRNWTLVPHADLPDRPGVTGRLRSDRSYAVPDLPTLRGVLTRARSRASKRFRLLHGYYTSDPKHPGPDCDDRCIAMASALIEAAAESHAPTSLRIGRADGYNPRNLRTAHACVIVETTEGLCYLDMRTSSTNPDLGWEYGTTDAARESIIGPIVYRLHWYI